MQILNNSYLKNISLISYMLLIPFMIIAQKQDHFEKRWSEINKGIKYDKPRQSSGLEDDFFTPQSLDEDRRTKSSVEKPPPSDEDIIYTREKNYAGGSDRGVEKHIKEDESQQIKDLTAPKTDAPERQSTSTQTNFENVAFFKILLLLIAIALIGFLIYHFFFKNKAKPNQKVTPSLDFKTEEVNPATISKIQLETELDKAIAKKDYRSAVRIYYLLLLKTLINKHLIVWANRKTNTHYLTEMRGQKEYKDFQKAIRMYEYTWYGKNNPNPTTFNRFSSFYKDILKRLKHG